MKSEELDVVNERDEVTGRATRREVHRLGLLHRAVHVWVFDGAGRMLLQKRSMFKDSHPGAWDSSCSGHVDAGEDYAQCVLRELREELGLEVEPGMLRELDYVAAGPETDLEFVRLYGVVCDGPFRPQPEEIDAVRFYTFSELADFLSGRGPSAARAFRFLLGRHLARLVDLEAACSSVRHGYRA